MSTLKTENNEVLDEENEEGICFRCIISFLIALGFIGYLVWWLFF